MLKKLFGMRNAKRLDDATHDLYTAIVTQARRPEFYAHCSVSDTVDGRFDLLALHCFLILHRLKQDGAAQGALSQALFDLMFADMDQSLREMGVSDVSVGAKVKTMAAAFYGRIAAYEPSLTDPAALGAALARNLYRGEPVDEVVLSAMVDYVMAQAAMLAALDVSELEQGRVRFGAPVMP